MSRILGYGFAEQSTAEALSASVKGRGLKQPARGKGPGITYPQPLPQGRGVFVINLQPLAHHGFCLAQRITRKADDTGWELSTGTEQESRFKVYDIFLNLTESIPAGYVMGVVLYEGLPTVEMVYCRAADWVTLPPP